MSTSSLWNPDLIQPAIRGSFRKLDPRILAKNPVMFVVEIGSTLTTVSFVYDVIHRQGKEALFSGQITLWLWFTVLFANFAEAMAEGRGKAQAENLKKARQETQASLREKNGKVVTVPSFR